MRIRRAFRLPEEMRTKAVAVRLDPETLEALERLSARIGLGRSTLVRNMVERVLAAQASGQEPVGTD